MTKLILGVLLCTSAAVCQCTISPYTRKMDCRSSGTGVTGLSSDGVTVVSTLPFTAPGFSSTDAGPTVWGMIPGPPPTVARDCPDGSGGTTFCETTQWVRSTDKALCLSVFSDATTVVGTPWCSGDAVATSGGGIIPLPIHGLTSGSTHGSWKILAGSGTPTWEAYGARGNVIRMADGAQIGNTFILPSTWSGSSAVKLRFTWFQNYDAGATVTFEAGASCSTDIQATTYTAVTLAETGPANLVTKTSSITLDMTGCYASTTGTVVYVSLKRNAGGSMTNLVNVAATAIEY